MDKRCQLEKVTPIITTLLIIGLILGVGFVVLQEFSDNQGDTLGTATNETIILSTSGTYADNNVTADNCFNTFTVSAVYNDSLLLNSGNYTYQQATGKVILDSDATSYSGATANVTYTYYYGTSESCDALANTTDAVDEIPGWLVIIVIIFIVGILLVIVFKILPSMGGTSSKNIAEI
jgi:hypothetical protein